MSFLLFSLVFIVACAPKEPITNFAVYEGRTLGPANASVKVLLYTDYSCPYCEKIESVVYELVKKYGNQIRFEHRNYIVHPYAYIAAEAAECAADQNKFWGYNEILFENQGDFSNVDLVRYANDLELNNTQFSLCLLEHKKRPLIENDMQEAVKAWEEAGHDPEQLGTPMIVINGQVLPGYRKLDDYSVIIDKELIK